jgi:hypothetical protein
MGAIKDIVDLCIQLRNENRDGKVSAAISQIQSLTLALQSEQAAIVEKNTELLTENLDLKRKLLDLEASHTHTISGLQERHRAEMAKIATSNAKPKDELDKTAREILKYIFDKADDFTDREIAQRFQIQLSVAGYHTDTLFRKGFIVATSIGGYMGITEQGRKYVVENGLAT